LDKGIENVFINEEHVLAFLKNCVKGAFSRNSCTANFLAPRNQEQMDTLEPLVACVAVCGCCRPIFLAIVYSNIFKLLLLL